MASIGDRVKEVRLAAALNQRDFAARLSTSSGRISEIEQCKTVPGGDFLAKLRSAFGADINYVLTGLASPYPTQTQSLHAELGVAEPPPAPPAGLSQDVREAIRMVADELHAQHKHPDGAQFVALVERALRYITQGRALERAEQATTQPKVSP